MDSGWELVARYQASREKRALRGAAALAGAAEPERALCFLGSGAVAACVAAVSTDKMRGHQLGSVGQPDFYRT